MELLNCPSPPDPYRLVMARIPELNNIQELPNNLSTHFPNRDVTGLSHKRIIEHHAVIASINEQLGHENWHLEHEVGGRPQLFIQGKESNLKISISHMQCPEKASYAATIIADVNYNIGVDIVYTNDSRIERIANRTMNSNEVESGCLVDIWALKEAVYKAFGPGVDFKNDIQVCTPIMKKEALVDFKGEKKKWLVHKVSCVTIALGPIK